MTYLLVSGRRDVDDAGGLLALQVGDEAGREVGGLLQHVHVVAPARQRQQYAVFVLHLDKQHQTPLLYVRSTIYSLCKSIFIGI